ncbi:hypothetical protein J4447_00615 [Candidatus Pacearchaeota archaeon]|nr:hypothetical protein [Candidatus Pacearchaeota archaeon]
MSDEEPVSELQEKEPEADLQLKSLTALVLAKDAEFPAPVRVRQTIQELPSWVGGGILEIDLKKRTWKYSDRGAEIGKDDPFYIDRYYGVIGVYDTSFSEQKARMNEISTTERSIKIVPMKV